MKENIEEDIIKLERFSNETILYGSTVAMTLEKYKDLQLSISNILSDYKRVLKENEERLQEKIDNQKIIALAQNEFLGYEQGYQDGKAGRGSAVQSVLENQQYYIIKKQIERYENQIEKLQKENEELKHKYDKALSDVIAGVDLDNTYIPKQKIKDKIEELEEKRIKMEKDDIGVGFTLGEEWSDLKSKIKAYKDLLEEKGE